MKKSPSDKLPEFGSDEEIAEFMEQYDGYDLLDAGLADSVTTPLFVRADAPQLALLKNKQVRIAFKDANPLHQLFSNTADNIFLVKDTDFTGVLVGLPNSPGYGDFYIPFLNIGGIELLN